MDAVQYLVVLGAGVGAGLAALVALYLLQRPSRGSLTGPHSARGLNEFTLYNGAIVDMSDDARRLGDLARQSVETWEDLRALFADRFPDMPRQVPKSQIICRAHDDPEAFLRIVSDGAACRVILDGTPPRQSDLHVQAMKAQELVLLRNAVTAAPSPMWQSDRDGVVDWHNAAYRNLCQTLRHSIDETDPFDILLPDSDTAQTTRIGIVAPNAQKMWYEVTTRRKGDRWLHYAIDINAIVTAEVAQRNFLQTLTKTFAHLPIGLAVFDRDRRLVLFNPALIDLTALPADFLSGRPDLASFFDHMRENRMMPEPKNYKSWREHMSDMTNAARDDRYSETWTLPSGLTYKITGRPHPDGAVAFLLEDISAEISLTRRFRSELEMSQSVLDTLEDAVAVFSHLGVLTFSNAAYRRMWRCDPDSAFAEMSIIDAIRQWQTECDPHASWCDLRNFVVNLRDRAPWQFDVRAKSGQSMTCLVEPVVAGATLVRFARQALPRDRTDRAKAVPAQ